MTPQERRAIRRERSVSPKTVLGRRDIEPAGFDAYLGVYDFSRSPRSNHRALGREPKI